MSSTFSGLSIAARGLYSSQAGLAVTSNNISNVNTAGYTRQSVNQSSVAPAAVYTGSVGGGSQVDSIDQVRNARLDQKYWRQNNSVGTWEAKSMALTEMEAILDETSSDGISSIMDDFYAALEDLSSDPSSSSARTVVQEMGNSICEYLNNVSEEFSQQRSDINGNIKTAVTSLNSYAEQIADLNQQIQVASANGADVNELKDKRTLLIDKLSALANIEVGEVTIGTQADGTKNTIVSITVNGSALVSGGNARQLAVYEINDGSTQDGMYGIKWQDTGEEFSAGGGELKAYLEIRDGTGTGSETKGIPYYMSKLDEFARTFAMAFNEGIYADGSSYYSGHADGTGADGSTEIRFFSYDGLSSDELMAVGSDTDSIYANITAANISLSKDVAEDVNKIAAASADGESDNNEVINDLISICEDSRMFNTGTPSDFIGSVISTLGTESSYAQRLYDNYSNILTNTETQRSSISGVSTNEETANLTAYQQAYEASAKIITTWDEIYQVTINLVSD